MQHSAPIAAHCAQLRLRKATGRYKAHNLPRPIANQPQHADLYCHCRNFPMPWTDIHLMRWNRLAYDALIRGV